jgi:glycosyltransferase involved in cell wall biosynthesis
MPYPALGGGHKRTLRLLEALERAGGIPHVVTTDPREDGAEVLRERGWAVDILEEPTPSQVRRMRQHLSRLPSPHLVSVARRLSELVAEAPPFVQIEQTQSAYYDRELGGVRRILSLHNVDSQMLETVARHERPLSPGWARAWNRTLAMRSVERRAVPRADAVICVSDRDYSHFKSYGGKPVLAPNGADDAFFSVGARLPDNEDVFFMGVYDYPPNAHGMLCFLREGWPLLAAARPNARLRLAGKGMGEELRRAVEESERVEALGFVDDLCVELERSRVVIVPLWQGGGTRLKVLEAMAAGRPVVGTTLGLEEVGVVAGRHAVIADDPAQIAEETAALLAGGERAARIAADGRALAESFRWSEVLRPVEDLYRRWLGQAAGSEPNLMERGRAGARHA